MTTLPKWTRSWGLILMISLGVLFQSSTSNPTGNLTTCILAPPGQQSQQLQANVVSKTNPVQQRTEQVPFQPDQSFEPAITTTILPPSPSVSFRSPTDSRGIFQQQPQQPGFQQQQPLQPGVGRRDGSSNNFWNQRNRTQRPESGFDSNVVSAYDDQQRQMNIQFEAPQIQSQRPSPQGPVYDRSGFRREPLHPAFGSDRDQTGQQPTSRVPSLINPDTSFRSQETTGSTWSTFTASPDGRGRDGVPTTNSPFDVVNPVTTSFFDPTRKPKTGFVQPTTTTRRPGFFDQDSRGLARPTTTPGLTREQTTPKTSPRKPSLGRSGQPTDRPTSGSDSDPTLRNSPDYAYIKQPISKVLDQPDLELEGKPVKFGIMKDALDRVGLLDLAEGPGPVTMFCPTDDAFMTLNDDVLTKLQQNPNFLRNTMLRHIVNFDVPPESLQNNIVVPSYSGEPLIINVVAGGKVCIISMNVSSFKFISFVCNLVS